MSDYILTKPRQPFKDLTGQKFGRLTALEYLGYKITDRGNKLYYWKCSCECGVVKDIYGGHLRSGKTVSCGCYRDEVLVAANEVHGGCTGGMSTEFRIWQNMKERCRNKNNKAYKRYGGRGITVCDEWVNDFAQFLKDVGKRPSQLYSLDRIDNNAGYSKANCKWSTKKEQARNRTTSHYVIYKGTKMTIAELGERSGIGQHNISKRLRWGYSAEEAAEIPLNSLR